jgi:integrase
MRQGWIEERTGNRGVSFRLRYWIEAADGAAIAKSESFPAWRYGGSKKAAKDAAESRLAEIRTDITRGTFVASSATTLRELIDTWLESKGDGLSPSSRYAYRTGLTRLPLAIAARPVQALTTLQLQRMFNQLAAGGHGAPILRTLATVLTGACNAGVRWGILHHSPMRGVKTPQTRDTRLRYWTPEQISTFLTGTADHRLATFWRLALLTGMRQGEMIALRWSDLSASFDTVTVARTLTRNASGSKVMGELTKTSNSHRTIPLPPTCVSGLKRHRTEQLERRLRSATWDTSDGELIFDSGRGRFLQPETMSRAFARLVDQLGLPKIPPHGMRHSCATALLIQGISPRTVADLLGDDVTTILKVYSHVTDDLRHGALTQLEAMLEELAASEEMSASTTT